VVVVREFVESWVGTLPPMTLFVLAVTLTAWYGGRDAGLLTTACSGLVAIYFYIEPIGSMAIGGHHQLFQLSVFLLQGSLISVLMGELHRTRGQAEESSRQARAYLEDVRRGEAALRQAERLAAIGQMMAGLAHESRNALQRGQACLEMLAARLPDRPDALDLLAGVQEAQDDLHRLYEEVLDYASPFLIERTRCRLGDLVRETWERLESTRRGRRAVLREHGDPELLLHADPFRLVQVLRNILDNALAACADPVAIDVAWDVIQATGGLENKSTVRIVVRDNGPGLAPEQRRNAFEPFYTTKTQGTGLGLPIARRIVEAHGGTLEVGSNARPGAELIITLPREEP
jgi:signal transduction histidine kinase